MGRGTSMSLVRNSAIIQARPRLARPADNNSSSLSGCVAHRLEFSIRRTPRRRFNALVPRLTIARLMPLEAMLRRGERMPPAFLRSAQAALYDVSFSEAGTFDKILPPIAVSDPLMPATAEITTFVAPQP